MLEVSRLVEMIENALDCNDEGALYCDAGIKQLEQNDARFAVIPVWTNGRAVSRYQGQEKSPNIRNRRNGYRKMVAIMVEVDGDDV